jgi:hypothetical protein
MPLKITIHRLHIPSKELTLIEITRMDRESAYRYVNDLNGKLPGLWQYWI